MEKIYTIRLALGVGEEDLVSIGQSERRHIIIAIGTKLKDAPDLFGKPLRRPLAGYWDLRVGNYRVIYRIQNRTVFILAIIHRRMGYDLKTQNLLNRRNKPNSY